MNYFLEKAEIVHAYGTLGVGWQNILLGINPKATKLGVPTALT